ncbi:hypothetical protein cco106_09681, partial [Campylobacter coli 2553]
GFRGFKRATPFIARQDLFLLRNLKKERKNDTHD